MKSNLKYLKLLTLKLLIMITCVSLFGQDNNLENDLIKMIEYATKAPSGHNTQPWRFIINENSIEIHPDLSKSLGVVDSDNRELYISLGCAAENLNIAAAEFGYLAEFCIRKVSDEYSWIHVSFKSSETQKDSLFNQITKRQTNRSVYDGRIIPEDQISGFSNPDDNLGVKIRFFKHGCREFDIIKEMIVKGNNVQMSDEAFKTELLDWIRFNDRQIGLQNDGLTYKVMGMPGTPRFMGRIIVKAYLKPKKQNASDMEKIDSSSHLVLFTAKNNDCESWIELGRIHQRFLLEASSYNIAVAYLNQPCEVKAVSLIMQNELELNNEVPMLLLRLGYAEHLPYSPRLELNDVIEIHK